MCLGQLNLSPKGGKKKSKKIKNNFKKGIIIEIFISFSRKGQGIKNKGHKHKHSPKTSD